MYAGSASRTPTSAEHASKGHQPCSSPRAMAPPQRTTAAGLMYATSAASPPLSVCSSTTASTTPGCARSACSISPSSIRCPRSFTCRSMRPPNSSSPSAVPPHTVASAVHDAAPRRVGAGPRVGHEALGGQLGSVEVATRHLHAAQPQLAPHADRLQIGGSVSPSGSTT